MTGTMTRTVAAPRGQDPQHIEMTGDEAAAFRADQAAFAAAQESAALKAEALAALERSDMVALRCFKDQRIFPLTWQKYVTALRAIVNGGPGPLPDRPAFP